MENRYIIEKNGKRRLAVEKQCEQCGKYFLVRKSWSNTQRYCSVSCKANASKKSVLVRCSYCGSMFEKLPSKLSSSRSGLYFCCREHKDLAQRLDFGCKEIMPSHYGTGNGEDRYRRDAFNKYEHKCAICGWDKDERILEVHHIDEDRSNNDLTNLIILCPICHRYLTLHIYTLEQLRENNQP